MESLHPRAIALGLERVQAVRRRLALDPDFAIVTVAGTNGKGSTVALLEAMLTAAGYRVGTYSSPHLIRYNERMRLDGAPVSDPALCQAFARVEAARADTPLTYFEFGTLAAVEWFRAGGCQIALLEVGLGGRLDAVNAWDADAAIVTAIGIDHTEWLGATRDSIAREKAGIFRPGRPAICADPDPPPALGEYAERIGARLIRIGRDFDFERKTDDWLWRCGQEVRARLPYPAMRGDYQLYNASAALMALHALGERFPVTGAQAAGGLCRAVLPGRFQVLPGRPVRVLDVAHNAQAAQALAATLRQQTVAGRTIAVAAMLKDKPIAEVLGVMAAVVDRWHVASLPGARGAPAAQLAAAVQAAAPQASVSVHDAVTDAYAAAVRAAGATDRIVVFGSFHTVGAILRRVQQGEDDGG